MKCKTVLDMLDDYVDNQLIGEEPALVDRHLASCPACARQAESLRALLEDAHQLPHDVQPRRDLWPAVHGEIERANRRKGARAWRWVATAAAAAVLLAVAGALLAREARPGAGEELTAQEAPAGLLLEVRRAQAEYERARGELVAAMTRTPHRVSPETHRVIEENIAVIDGAIREIRASIEQDPDSVFLFDMLVAEQDRGLELLGLQEQIESNSW